MTSGEGNPFRSSGFEMHNEGIAINEWGVEVANLKQVH